MESTPGDCAKGDSFNELYLRRSLRSLIMGGLIF